MLKNQKNFTLPLELAERLNALAIYHGVKAPVLISALLDVAEASDDVIDPFIQRSKTKDAEVKSKIASERAKTTHARRKALQVQNDGVE